MSNITVTLTAGPANAARRGHLANTWLPAFHKEWKASDRLLRLASNRKEGPDKAALFSGYFAVLRELDETIKNATKVGGLLLLWDGSTALKGGAA